MLNELLIQLSNRVAFVDEQPIVTSPWQSVTFHYLISVTIYIFLLFPPERNKRLSSRSINQIEGDFLIYFLSFVPFPDRPPANRPSYSSFPLGPDFCQIIDYFHFIN